MTTEHLREFATTVRQIEILDALRDHGSHRKAAKALGCGKSTITNCLDRIAIQAAKRDPAQHQYNEKPVPAGFVIKGVSQYVDKDGKVAGQWIKSSVDAEKQAEMMKAMIEAMCADIPKATKSTAPDANHLDDLIVVIPIGDPHHGLYAWALESGDDFDNAIAKRLTLGAVDRLMSSTPNAKTCIILPLGDVFHANDQSNVTPGHKHQLDVDSRFVKVLQIGIETYRHAIIRALEKHEEVIVRFVAGNHDPQAIWALAFTIQAYFSEEPRVKVDLSPSKFWFHQFGNVLIGATHGDTVKHEALLGVMACDQAVAWGQTKHRYWYTGHVHHTSVKEFPGVICESFRTLAAKDAYAAGHGYRAGRDMVAIVHHRLHGEVERHRCDIGMIE